MYFLALYDDVGRASVMSQASVVNRSVCNTRFSLKSLSELTQTFMVN